MKNFFLRIGSYILIAILLFTTNPIKKYVLGPTSVHKTIYVSSTFNDEDFTLIVEAASEWQKETNGLVYFEIKRGFNFDLYQSLNGDDSSMVMITAPVNDPLLDALDNRIGGPVLGYFLTEFPTQIILVVPDRMIGVEYYRAVMIHEMGHSIGLGHINIDNTIMVSSMDRGSYHLSKTDIELFCRAYYCNSKKLGGI